LEKKTLLFATDQLLSSLFGIRSKNEKAKTQSCSSFFLQDLLHISKETKKQLGKSKRLHHFYSFLIPSKTTQEADNSSHYFSHLCRLLPNDPSLSIADDETINQFEKKKSSALGTVLLKDNLPFAHTLLSLIAARTEVDKTKLPQVASSSQKSLQEWLEEANKTVKKSTSKDQSELLGEITINLMSKRLPELLSTMAVRYADSNYAYFYDNVKLERLYYSLIYNPLTKKAKIYITAKDYSLIELSEQEPDSFHLLPLSFKPLFQKKSRLIIQGKRRGLKAVKTQLQALNTP